MPIVKVTLSHPSSGNVVMEKRVALETTIESLKATCERHFGTPPERQRLVLKNISGAVIESSMKDDKQLGFYQCEDDWSIDVVDTDPSAQDHGTTDWSDVSKVEKFEITEEAYAKRDDTVRAFKERCVAQQRAAMEAQGIAPKAELHVDSYKEEAELVNVGDRCLVFPGDRLGEVKYVGRVPSIKPGFFIGVKFDEPVGKNTGAAGGHQYFECPPKYGGFVRPEHVTVGDFPPEEF